MAAIPNYSHVNETQPFWASAFDAILPSPNLQVSSIAVNMDGNIRLESDNGITGAAIEFADTSQIPIYMRNTTMPDQEENPFKGVGITFSDQTENDPIYAPLGVSELFLMGDNQYSQGSVAVFRKDGGTDQNMAVDTGRFFTSNLWVSTINGLNPGTFSLPSNATFSNVTVSQSTITNNLFASNSVFQSTFTNAAIISSATISTATIPFISSVFINTQNVNTSTINGTTINASTTTANTALFSSLITTNISSVFGDFTFQLVSTLSFNPSLGGVNLGGVNLGMGDFLGGIVGGVGSGIFNTIVGGTALATGIIALTNSRANNQINSNNYEMINTQTQLQVSTLGQSTISYTRLVSSINPQSVPGKERIISTIVQAGTTCIRSFSDPINPANPSTGTSTIQSFGSWVPLPSQSNISTFNFATISSLTVSSINGAPYTPGGGGGGGFDFNSAMQQLSTNIQWNYNDPDSFYLGQIVRANSAPQYISSSVIQVKTGNTIGGYSNINANGIYNLWETGGAYGLAQMTGGDLTIGSPLASWCNQIAASTLITLHNNYSTIGSGLGQLQVLRTSAVDNENNVFVPVSTGAYADLACGNFTANGNINATGSIGTNGASYGINITLPSSITKQGYITAAACSDGTFPDTFHNIGGLIIGDSDGSAISGYGRIKTPTNAAAYLGGVQLLNGQILANATYPLPGFTSQINNMYFDAYAGAGGNAITNPSMLNGSNPTNFNIYKPGVYLFTGSTSGYDTSNEFFAYRVAYVHYRGNGVPNGTLHLDWLGAATFEGGGLSFALAANDVRAPLNVYFNWAGSAGVASLTSMTGLSWLSPIVF